MDSVFQQHYKDSVFFAFVFVFIDCFSERADPSYCKDRITEGANINKSLVTLGIVISTLGILLIDWIIRVGGRLWKITHMFSFYENRVDIYKVLFYKVTF